MILHIDMDAFYASVEQLDNPWLRGKCVLVGGTSDRGVVMAASYEARRFGVRSATPIFKAREMCPEGIFIPPRMKRYKEVSKKIMSALREFTPEVEVVSIDEAYMDISGSERLHGDPEKVARAIKKDINVKAKTITLKLKHADFKQISRSKTVAIPTQSSKTIYRHAARLLEEYRLVQKVRLVGVGTSGFKSNAVPVQLELFDRSCENDSCWTKVERTLETINQKFGKDAIKRASLSEE